jgi:filamentous hemagglutinin
MIPQNESGDQSATTRSAVSAGAVDVTNQGAQTQDVANLSRDTMNTNGTVSNTPDVNNILNKQADTMQAAQAAGQAVAQGIGAYADMKRDDAAKAVEAAANANDPQALAAALTDYMSWREGGDSRAELQAAGGALVGGLGGGAVGAIGGAAGAAISSKLADQTRAAANAVTDATGSSLIGNISGNILAGLAGGIVGGGAGAAAASNVNLYNEGRDTEAAAKDAQVKGVIERALGSAPDLGSISLGSLVDQFIGLMNAGAKAKMSEPATDLVAQGAANGIAAGIGMGGGKPPAASPGVVLADTATGQAANAVPGMPGYVPSNAIFNSGSNGPSSASNGKTSDLENVANEPFRDGQAITNAGRAATKHPEYFGFDSTQAMRQTYRSDAQLNELASKAVQDILQDGTKTTGAGGRYPDGWVTYTLPDGRAASWTASGEFIGFRGLQK